MRLENSDNRTRNGLAGLAYARDARRGGRSFGAYGFDPGLPGAPRIGRLDGPVGTQGLFRQHEARGEQALTPSATTTSGGLLQYQELPLGAA